MISSLISQPRKSPNCGFPLPRERDDLFTDCAGQSGLLIVQETNDLFFNFSAKKKPKLQFPTTLRKGRPLCCQWFISVNTSGMYLGIDLECINFSVDRYFCGWIWTVWHCLQKCRIWGSNSDKAEWQHLMWARPIHMLWWFQQHSTLVIWHTITDWSRHNLSSLSSLWEKPSIFSWPGQNIHSTIWFLAVTTLRGQHGERPLERHSSLGTRSV